MGFFDGESSTTTQPPEDVQEYRNELLGEARRITNREFPAYDPRDRVAPMGPDQRASFQMARNTIGSTQPFMNSALNTTAARQNPDAQATTIAGRTPQPSATTMQAPETPSAATVDTDQIQDVEASDVEASDVEAQTFPDAQLDQYMNPYIDEVIDTTTEEMQRELQIAQNQQMQDFAAAGAFGGARQAIAQSENIRNFADRLGQRVAQLRSEGYTQAADQIARDQNRQLEASRANQQAALEAARANQRTGLEAALSNQAARNTMRQLGAEQEFGARANNMGALNDMSQFNAELGMEGLLADQQAVNNMRQFNERLGLAASDQLGQLALEEQQRQQQDIGFLNELGRQQQQQDQRVRDAAYEEFRRRVQWPERQIGLRSDILQGVPVGQRQTTTNDPSGASWLGAGASLLGGGGSLISAF